jgi:2-polyprenyl-3-methyl-5-hydroxy-6-metoxy-1,4-benzoquinol methylase
MGMEITDWLNEVHQYIKEKAPEILPHFEVYQAEAEFGRKFINDDLLKIGESSKILEVGAGTLLLSCQLVREGFQVYALEPVADGFSHFTQLRELVLEVAKKNQCVPILLNEPVETLRIENFFEYAFSINVMEHVDDVSAAIERVTASLVTGASYHFTCPNYTFPYEPHFDMPTLISKSLTEKVFRNMIFQSKKVPDPRDVWRTLNWITVREIKKILSRLPNIDMNFNRWFIVTTLERVSNDEQFFQRRAKWLQWVITVLTSSRLHKLFGLVPIMMQPVIDCKLIKKR